MRPDTVYGRDDAWFVHADSTGNFLNAKAMGSSLWDYGQMIYPLSNGNVIAGGDYYTNDGFFTTLGSYGGTDVFITVFEPWNQTEVKQVSLINSEVKIYPNPATEDVTIELQQKGNYDVAITDVLGRSIYKASFIDKIKIAVDKWPKGVYYVQMSGEGCFKTIKKIIVE